MVPNAAAVLVKVPVKPCSWSTGLGQGTSDWKTILCCQIIACRTPLGHQTPFRGKATLLFVFFKKKMFHGLQRHLKTCRPNWSTARRKMVSCVYL